MSNTPITRFQSKQLPTGFTPTSDGFPRKKRRSKEFQKMMEKFHTENAIKLAHQIENGELETRPAIELLNEI